MRIAFFLGLAMIATAIQPEGLTSRGQIVFAIVVGWCLFNDCVELAGRWKQR
jgi:hypothetical protein